MIIELKQVFDNIDESFLFDYTMDLTDYELFDDRPFITPIRVKGEVSNRAGVVVLNYTSSFTLKLQCDRCLKVYNRYFNFSFKQILVTELNSDSDEYVVLEDYHLNLDDLCLSDILLNLPSKLLCDQDCKGLCATCGVDLNIDSCLCKKNEVDPRLVVLSQLLIDDDD